MARARRKRAEDKPVEEVTPLEATNGVVENGKEEAGEESLPATLNGSESVSTLVVHEEAVPVVGEIVIDGVLTAEERERLSVLEEEVTQGFQLAGRALKEIHERKLYREEYGTFEAYCERRFGLKRRHPYHLMTASIVADTLRARGVHILPTGEYQLRPLAQVKEPERQVEVWEHALEKSGGKSPTYTQVLESVREVVGTPPSSGEKVPSFSPGDVCVVKRTTDKLLFDRKGFWAIVDEVRDDTVTLSLYDRTLDGVKSVDLEALPFKTKRDKEKRAKILSSLKSVYNTLGTSEEAVTMLLSYFGRVKRLTLTSFEQELLSYLERQAKKAEDDAESAEGSSDAKSSPPPQS